MNEIGYHSFSTSKYLKQLAAGLEVEPILSELAANEDLWNAYTLRTSGAAPAHNEVSDIWVRYRSWDHYLTIRQHYLALVDEREHLVRDALQRAAADFVGHEHESTWYPAIDKLPSLRSLIFEVCRYWEVERLGGVLITRIPPGGSVKPHIDRGWHATYYEKIAVQLASNPSQAFHFEDGEFRCEPGTVYTFDNNFTHWVSNDSAEPRMTCIVCVRRDQRHKRLVDA